MSSGKKGICTYSFIGGGLTLLILSLLLFFTPLPATIGVANQDGLLESLIGWGLSRQTIHAALTLSALVGLFSLLRLDSDILQKSETKVAFAGFLAFISYEYFKLIRSFQIVNQWERLLSSFNKMENLFPLDVLQDCFIGANNTPILCRSVIQALLMAFVVFILIGIYIHACDP